MDLSALIFVALAVAWAVYLVPKALKHHEDVVRSRSVDRFSHTMRVLARREPVSSSSARLVVTPGRAPSVPLVVTKASSALAQRVAEATAEAVEAAAPSGPSLTPAQRRGAARRAARRRRRVLLALVLGLLAVVALAAFRVVAWPYVAVPGTLLLAWLVACRLMVRRERGISGPLSRIPAAPAEVEEPAAPAVPPAEVAGADAGALGEDTADVPAVALPLAEAAVRSVTYADQPAAPAEPGLWDPVPVTLPTYVSKPVAERRSVRTIDLESTGVWTSGRTEADSALARDADQRRRDEAGGSGEAGRAVGS